MRSSSLQLCKSGCTFADQLTLPSTILRSSRSPQERYNRCWDSGLTSAPPLSPPRSTSTGSWIVSRESYILAAFLPVVSRSYLLPTQIFTSGRNGNLLLGTSPFHSNDAFRYSARPWNISSVSALSATISSHIKAGLLALSRRTPNLWWFKQTKASDREQLIQENNSNLQLETILETLRHINV